MNLLKTLFRRRPRPAPICHGGSPGVGRLVEALGLRDRMIKHLRIDVPAAGLVEVRAIFYVQDDQAGAMAEIFKEYRLVEHEPPAGGEA